MACKNTVMIHIQMFTFSPVQENTYLLYNEHNECIIIDPGCYFDEEKDALKSFIEQNNTNCFPPLQIEYEPFKSELIK